LVKKKNADKGGSENKQPQGEWPKSRRPRNSSVEEKTGSGSRNRLWGFSNLTEGSVRKETDGRNTRRAWRKSRIEFELQDRGRGGGGGKAQGQGGGESSKGGTDENPSPNQEKSQKKKKDQQISQPKRRRNVITAGRR